MNPRYFLQTFGCQMNVHDSDRMSELLDANGFTAADGFDDADLVVFNTCSVREKAEQKLRSELGKLAPLKQKKPDMVLAVTGCVAQQEGERLLTRVPLLDMVLGPDNLTELPHLFHHARNGGPPLSRTVFDLEAPTFLASKAGRGKSPVSAYVTTMKGCDERCSFCIVPTTRGEERYRPAGEILDEIEALVASGTREVVLLGQTVDSYRDPSLPAVHDPTPISRARHGSPDASQFPHLLRRIAERVPQLARLRYTSPHPRHLTPELCQAHAELPMLAHHVHMPVQSGSNRVLKRMIRRYTREEYIERVDALRRAVPGLTLSTDIIVGFPGETEEDFAETLSLVREVGFVSLFGFKYSERPFTAALKLGDDVTEEQKSDRLARLFATAEELTRAHLLTLVGSRQQVLVEGPGKSQNTRLQGRTAQNEIVHLDDDTERDLIGRVVEVEILQAFKHSLDGRLADGQRELLPPKKLRPAQRDARALVVL